MALKIAGIVLIVFGIVDLAGSYMGFDLWGTIGIPLPLIVWKYSSFIEIGLGYFLFNMGKNQSAAADDAQATPTE